jgi:hypothetical protein
VEYDQGFLVRILAGSKQSNNPGIVNTDGLTFRFAEIAKGRM